VNTKLTLRLDEGLIERAKRHSAKTGKSVSRLVADFFTLIDTREYPATAEISARVRGLTGVLSSAGVSEADYREHLEEKHR